MLLTAVYLPPQGKASVALDQLYGAISRLENMQPDAMPIVQEEQELQPL